MVGVANYHAFLYSNGNMQDLGDLDGGGSKAYAINAAGQVVGGSWVAIAAGGATHAFLDSNGSMSDLGTLAGYADSCALGINASGQIVGEDDNISGITYRAFIFGNGTMTDLNTLIDTSSRWTLEEATAINDNGWIVGYGLNPNGQQDAFLLTPAGAVPEPSSFIMLCAAVIWLFAYARRRKL